MVYCKQSNCTPFHFHELVGVPLEVKPMRIVRNKYHIETLKACASIYVSLFGPRREKTCLRGFANNTGADQPAHPRSLISTFVIRV